MRPRGGPFEMDQSPVWSIDFRLAFGQNTGQSLPYGTSVRSIGRGSRAGGEPHRNLGFMKGGLMRHLPKLATLVILALVVSVQPARAADPAVGPAAAAAEPVTAVNLLPDISGLAFQVPFLAVKLALSLGRTMLVPVIWIMNGADSNVAKQSLEAAWAGPWGWPGFLRGLGAGSKESSQQ